MASPNFCVSFVPKTISDYCSCRCLIPLLLASALLLGGCKNPETPSSSEDNTTSSGDSSSDTTAPTLAEVTAVSTPTSDTTPNYTFSSSEAGTITYGGSCSSGTTSASNGNNTVTFNTLSDGTYSKLHHHGH